MNINEKSLLSYPNFLKNIFSCISFNKDYNIVGSNSIRGMLYGLDYDLNMHLLEHNTKEETIKYLSKSFKTMFEIIKKNPNIYFIGFRAMNEQWTLNELIKGRKENISFNEAFIKEDDSLFLEIIYRENYGDFVEISMMYFLDSDNKTLDEHNKSVDYKLIKDFQKDVKKFIKQKKYYKALKRLFVIYQIEHKDKNLSLLFHLFNSDLGIISKVKSNIEVVLELLDKYNIELNEFKFTLQSQKEYLNNIVENIFLKHVFEDIDLITNLKTKSKFKNKLSKLNDEMNEILQRETKVWINKHENIKKDLHLN